MESDIAIHCTTICRFPNGLSGLGKNNGKNIEAPKEETEWI